MPWQPERSDMSGKMSVVVDQTRGPLGMNMSGMVLSSVDEGSSARQMLLQCIGLTLTHISHIAVHSGQDAARVMAAERAKPTLELTFQSPSLPPHASPRMPAAPPTEIVVPKAPSGEIGCVFDETLLEGVIPGSTADRHGGASCVGRTVTHVNEIPVANLDDICRAASRSPFEVRLRFAPGGAQPPHRRAPHPHSPPPPPPPQQGGPVTRRDITRSITPPRPAPPAVPLGSVVSDPLPPREPLYLANAAAAPPPPPRPAVVHIPYAVPVPVMQPQHVHHVAAPASPRVALAPASPPPASQPAEYELVVAKQEGEKLGLQMLGLTLQDVELHTPAYRAGAQRFIGMQLTHINGEPVSSLDTLNERKGTRRVVVRFTDVSVDPLEVTIDKRPHESLGCRLVNMVLRDVNPDTAGERAGLRRFIGRLMTHINGHPVFSTSDVQEAVQASVDGRIVARFLPVGEALVPVLVPEVGTRVLTKGLLESKVGNGAEGVVQGQVTTQEGETVVAVDFAPPHGRQLVRTKNLEAAPLQPAGVAEHPRYPSQQHQTPLPVQYLLPVPGSAELSSATLPPTAGFAPGLMGGEVFESPVQPISPRLRDSHHPQPMGSPYGMGVPNRFI